MCTYVDCVNIFMYVYVYTGFEVFSCKEIFSKIALTNKFVILEVYFLYKSTMMRRRATYFTDL